jgi:hypothetical protein
MGPGVPRLLNQDAVARLQAVKDAVAGGAQGVNSPQKAIECLGEALRAGNALALAGMWSVAGDGKVDPRRVQRAQGGGAFVFAQTMVEYTLDAIRLGWIVNTKLQADLLAVVDETVRADRVLAAVVIDDAILAKADAVGINKAQEMLKQADALAKEAAVWPQFDKKASVFCDAIDQYRNAWKAALDLVP